MTAAAPTRRSPVLLLLEWLPRVLVAALFVYTGSTKILDPATFIKEVRAYELIPVLWSNLLAFVLPWVEVFAALLLLSGLWRREARLIVAGLLIVFLAAKGIVIGQGRRVDCGCVPTSSFLHVLFDGKTGLVTNLVLLAFLAVEGYLEFRRRRPSAPPVAPAEACEPTPA